MWPKVIAQLWELLPHASRLVPVAQKYFEQRNGDAEVLAPLQNAMSGLSTSNETLARHIQEQAQLITGLTAEIHDLRSTNAAMARRLDAVETAANSASLWSKVATAFALITTALAIFLVVRH